MPKQVDHDQRRTEIATAAWQLIAEHGVDAATMRAISDSMGMANGALKHYFPNKNAIIRTAFTRIFDNTNARISARLGDATGLDGLRIFCQEVMPAEEVTKLEARVVLPFWQRALADADLESVYRGAMDVWRKQIRKFLRAGRAAGTIRTPVSDKVIVEQLLAILNGVQTLALLTPETTTPRLQRQMIDVFLNGLTENPAG
ncbi:TetR/AcrR family transcriptional regulator [Amycolatopsis taiwanensis]|uniref:HTH-type transcriptional regulator PksA n=1 Tax=Amycolatopsis taiwanensis TaxID=342230 RepID=A0A9W6QZM6_9PSEU|nr:TetR/AcrR family transcriptional regulator [Amycolatopsis taiwanensis]GLY64870.1 HTH-type transcriptional regulator PksA [Amycolatopsis taiwanensis]